MSSSKTFTDLTLDDDGEDDDQDGEDDDQRCCHAPKQCLQDELSVSQPQSPRPAEYSGSMRRPQDQRQINSQAQKLRETQIPVTSSYGQGVDFTGRRTTSESPPPGSLLPGIPPKTPICIGQLSVNALVLYHIDYIKFDGDGDEWACVRLRCIDGDGSHKPGAQDTIEISSPEIRRPDGTSDGGETFGYVEQRATSALGPMLAKAIIKCDARIRKVATMPPILPLELLVFTPKGNIDIVADFLQRANLMLDHPAADNSHRLENTLYHNPHNPPPGGFRNALRRST